MDGIVTRTATTEEMFRLLARVQECGPSRITTDFSKHEKELLFQQVLFLYGKNEKEPAFFSSSEKCLVVGGDRYGPGPDEYRFAPNRHETYLSFEAPNSSLTCRVLVHCPVAASHTLTLLSELAVASWRPSGLYATLVTLPVWPCRCAARRGTRTHARTACDARRCKRRRRHSS